MKDELKLELLSEAKIATKERIKVTVVQSLLCSRSLPLVTGACRKPRLNGR